MKRYCMPTLLVFSLALNVGVLATVGINMFEEWVHADAPRGHHMLVDYLDLTERQRPAWRQKERNFMENLTAAWVDIRDHRERMIREIFSQSPDRDLIERERAAISALQERQQRQVIEQLMAEREILEPDQRRRLAELLVEQNPVGSLEEVLTRKLHRP